jgi:undecaprenyl-phosphate galactose phosphotransferase
MKNILSRFALIFTDMFVIYFSIVAAYFTRVALEPWLQLGFNEELSYYAYKPSLYIIVFLIFLYEGIYTKRYDFWHESRKVFKSLALAFLMIFAFFALSKTIELVSRLMISFIFIYMLFLIPISKNITKKLLFKIGLWQLKAKVYGEDNFLREEIFSNPYLGYVSCFKEEVNTVFVNSQKLSADELKSIINKEMHTRREIIFIPIINDYNITQSTVYELTNARTNLVVFKNRLKSKSRVILQNILNYIFALLILPFVFLVIAIIAILIKIDSKGPVFFTHNRIGKEGITIPTYKFRSMYSDAKERLEKLLSENKEIQKEWEASFKLKDDPRVTRVGAFLRKTSLDELPQIFNILRGEMNFVGPRPVLQEELDLYYKEDTEYYNMVKPGITGLWQVSGRSDTDYDFRVATDKWYVRNWSIWLDVVILLRTIKVVLFRQGAY